MKQGKEIILRSKKSIPNAEQPETLRDLSDLDPAFLEKLSLFPIEIRDAFAELSPEIRKKLFSSAMTHPEQREIEKILEDSESRRRHANQWTKDEVEAMDSAQRELFTRYTLSDFLYNINIREIVEQNPKAVVEIMNSLWDNRGRSSDAIELYRAKYFNEVQHELHLIASEKKKLEDEINRLEAKKRLSRPSQKRIRQLKGELSNYSYYKQGRKRELDSELQKLKSEQAWQSTLAFMLPYMDASDFSIIFSETIDSTLIWFKRFSPKESAAMFQEISLLIESWHNKHQQDQPLKETPKKNISFSLEWKQRVLGEHFWALFNSYLSLKNWPTKTEETTLAINHTLRQLAVVLYSLK